MNELQAERLASNQALFRVVNEQMALLNGRFEPHADGCVAFVCECSHLGCVEHVQMTPEAYAAVRGNPRRFVVAPSYEHVFTEIERVVTCTGRYFVVETVGVAAEVAEQMVGR
jgi:hypothetical protein